MYNKWMKGAIFSVLAGFLCWGIIFITDVSYPHTLFQILMPLGLFLVFLSLPLFVLSWIITIRQEFKVKNYLIASLWIIVGILWVLLSVPKFL